MEFVDKNYENQSGPDIDNWHELQKWVQIGLSDCST